MPVQRVIATDHCSAWRQTSEQAGGGTGVEVVHPLERGLVMDGVQECQTPSKRLKAILSVPKWQKQMAEIEAGSHSYELPDIDAFQVMYPLWGFWETWLTR